MFNTNFTQINRDLEVKQLSGVSILTWTHSVTKTSYFWTDDTVTDLPAKDFYQGIVFVKGGARSIFAWCSGTHNISTRSYNGATWTDWAVYTKNSDLEKHNIIGKSFNVTVANTWMQFDFDVSAYNDVIAVLPQLIGQSASTDYTFSLRADSSKANRFYIKASVAQTYQFRAIVICK